MKSITGIPKYFLPNLGMGWLTVLMMLPSSIFAVLVVVLLNVALYGKVSESLFDSGGGPLLYALCMFFPILFVFIMGIVRRRNPLVAPVKINQPHFGKVNPLILGVILIVLLTAVGWMIAPVSDLIEIPDVFKKMFENIRTDTFSIFLTTAFMAPIIEEFLCRGVLARGLYATSSPTSGIVWSAIMFSVMHLNLYQMLSAFVAGLLFAWIYYRTHSIWIVIFGHFMVNASSLTMAYIYPEYSLMSSKEYIIHETGNVVWYWILFAGGTIITVALIALLNKLLPKNITSFTPQPVIIASKEDNANLTSV